jgi:hypothetical protein
VFKCSQAAKLRLHKEAETKFGDEKCDYLNFLIDYQLIMNIPNVLKLRAKKDIIRTTFIDIKKILGLDAKDSL